PAAEAEAAGDPSGRARLTDRRVDFLEALRCVVAEDLQDALALSEGGGDVEHDAAVVFDAKGARVEEQRVRRHDAHDRAELGFGTPEELAARGNVLEQLAHADRRAAVARRGALRALAGERIAFDLDRMLALAVKRREREARDAGDRRQCFAAKAERADARQIVEETDLRRRMAFEREPCIIGLHAAAVVANLDELAPAALEENVDRVGAGIDGVLDQFLDDGSGTLDHLTRRDLIDEIRGEDVDAGHWGTVADSRGRGRLLPSAC